MQYRFNPSTRVNVFFSFFLLASLSVLVILPFKFGSGAASRTNEKRGLAIRTVSHEPGLENYDIRSDKSDEAAEKLIGFRNDLGKTASEIADSRSAFVDGEVALKRRVVSLKIEYNRTLRIPEVIAPDSNSGGAFLTKPSGTKRSEILRNFIKTNSSLIGVDDEKAGELKLAADYVNPRGNMAFAHLLQTANGIPVFQGDIKAGFTVDGKIVRVINNLAPALDYQFLSTDFGDAENAVRAAAAHIDYKLQAPDLTPNESMSTDLKTVFGEGEWPTTAEKTYFPTEVGVARPAWRVIIWQPVNAYMVVVDAETGTLFWRKNLTEDQTQTATYQVYRNANAFIDVADSPAPMSPGPNDPGLGTQGPLLVRQNVTLIGNEGDLSFNGNGWIDDGDNSTAGNNTIAGIDASAPDGVDAPVTGANRVFSSTWNPPPGNPAPGDAPTVQVAKDGAVIQMFYVVNRYHDILYKMGFTEPAFNFQNDNFGRGGAGNDRVSSEGQDSSGTNNANFSTPPDGQPGKMQMYRFTGSNPDRDGTADADIIIHELTHGTSNRLHGNSAGLSSAMARSMGEGWGDWYGHVLTSEPGDPINGVYTTGGYVLMTPTDSTNFYYGIRSQPKAVMAFTGGPNNRPHNSLTFADIDQSTANNSDGAFPAAFGPNFGSPHFAGEVWSSALWEVHALLVTRLGFQTGNERVLQIVTDGMKLSPIDPTYLQGRNAIVDAARANGNSADTSADVADVWEGFRIRGMGFSASIESTSPLRVTEAFDSPNVAISDQGFALSDAPGDNDGFPEPGENVLITVPIQNNTGAVINNVAVNINGGLNVSYGNIADGVTVSKQISFAIPPATNCGGILNLSINISGSAGARTENRTFVIGAPSATTIENFDGVTAPALPTGWSSTTTGNGVAFVTQTGTADSNPNSVFTPNTGLAGPNNGAILESREFAINAEAGIVSFRNRYDTEGGWDGGVLELNIGVGAFQDIIAAGGRFIEGGYNGSLGANSNPLDNRAAWTGNSGGYIDSVVQLPAAANGQNVRFRWRFGEDTNTSSVGWNIDGVRVVTDYSCNVTNPTNKTRFDYDGDRKTDISIFRPGPGEWWYLRSSDNGAYAAQFGSTTDKIVPADFTGDGKTDIAFWRESSGEWFVLRSEDDSFFAFPFGTTGDIPVPGDYDGDGKADPAVFRPSESTWYILNSGGGTTIQQFGANGDIPIAEDYDGDRKIDLAVFRPSVSEWYIQRSTDTQVIGFQFGATGDKAVPADFTGDGKADVAFWRPSSGEWFVLRSEDDSFFAFPFGVNGDIPVPGDYDGDGKADPAVFRPSDSNWFKLQSTNGFEAIAFGINGDIPTPSAYIP